MSENERAIAWTEKHFEQWTVIALPGRWCLYYTGYLANARETNRRADVMAKTVWRAYEAGLVHLFQRRIGPGNFEYLAQRSKRRLSDVRETRESAFGGGRG